MVKAPTTIITGGTGTKRLYPTKKTYGAVQPWVKVMIGIMKYQDCKIHSDAKEKKLDQFCIDCVAPFCKQGSWDHQGHEQIKIRRYVYNDVIKRSDFQKYFDCSRIQIYKERMKLQCYLTNKNKVLFLKSRKDNQQSQEHQQNTRDPKCKVCSQSLIDASYCSIQCKVFAITAENKEGANVDDNVVLHDANEEPAKPPTMRKRPRKGIPHRSPMF